MFDSLVGNDEVKTFLKNELRQEKSSGTYLFYGKRGSSLMEFALAFAKALNCPVLEGDFCDQCPVCKKISSLNYADLEVMGEDGGVKIDQVRDLIYKASSSSYEGRKKVFILKDVNRMRKEAANALLKEVEEPQKNTFFILLSNSLNIIPTIISRSIVVEIKKPTNEELGVSREEYDFFIGNIEDIRKYKNGEYIISRELNYMEIGGSISKFLETGDLGAKIDIFCCIEDFVKNIKLLNDLQKLRFAKAVSKSVKNRVFIEELLYYIILKVRDIKKTEKLLDIKSSIGFNVNLDLALNVFFLTI
jgi:DNA polymerase-3 subunit delta'